MRLRKKKLQKQAVALAVAAAVTVSVPATANADFWYLEDGDITVTAEKDETSGSEKQMVKQDKETGTVEKEDKDPIIRDFKKDWSKSEGGTKEDDKDADGNNSGDSGDSGNAGDSGTGDSGNSGSTGESGSGGSGNAGSDSGGSDSGDTEQEPEVTDNTLTIKAKGGATANVTIQDVNIDVSDENSDDPDSSKQGKAAIKVEAEKDSTVVIEIDGDNTVESGNMRAGVEKGRRCIYEKLVGKDENGEPIYDGEGDNEEVGDLIIQDKNDVEGSLDAKGGKCGAGIGGSGVDQRTGTANITIDGGTITAEGGSMAAGIGGGYQGNGWGEKITKVSDKEDYVEKGKTLYAEAVCADAENITIKNAKVTASGGAGVSWVVDGNDPAGGAGIGGGRTGSAKGIYIENSTVTATGSRSAAGIGGGCSASTSCWNGYFRGGSAEDIKIVNSEVTATGNSNGAGIGGADNKCLMRSSNLKLNPRMTVKYAADNITIENSEVTATGGTSGAGIGGGSRGDASNITITDSDVTATSTRGAGIGGGYGGSVDGVTIQGNSDVLAKSASGGAGIGGGTAQSTYYTYYTNGCGYSNAKNITISGGTVKAYGGNEYTSTGTTPKTYYGGSGIGGGYGGNGEDILITGDADVLAVGGTRAAGIGGGADEDGYDATTASINITKNVKLHAYADGVKMAVQSKIASDLADADSNDILNGRFKAGVLADNSGENLFEVVDAEGNVINTFSLPIGTTDNVYRSFAVDLPDADVSIEKYFVFNSDGKYLNNITGYKADARTVVYAVPDEQMLNADEIAFPENSITYAFASGTPNMELPQAVLDQLPSGTEQNVFTLEDLRRLIAPKGEFTSVREGNGTWVFVGWDPDGQTMLNDLTLDDLAYTGTWVYVPDRTKDGDDDDIVPVVPVVPPVTPADTTVPTEGTTPEMIPVGETTTPATGTTETGTPASPVAPADATGTNSAPKLPQSGAPWMQTLGLAAAGLALSLGSLFGKGKHEKV